MVYQVLGAVCFLNHIIVITHNNNFLAFQVLSTLFEYHKSQEIVPFCIAFPSVKVVDNHKTAVSTYFIRNGETTTGLIRFCRVCGRSFKRMPQYSLPLCLCITTTESLEHILSNFSTERLSKLVHTLHVRCNRENNNNKNHQLTFK
jgi:hypothetical protein